MCLSTAAFLPHYIKKSHAHLLWACQSVEKPLSLSKNGVWGVAPSRVRAAAPHSAPSRGEGVWGFGKDAEIERPKALQDAKPTKRSYRNREFAIFFKNKLFLQADTPTYYGRVVFS